MKLPQQFQIFGQTVKVKSMDLTLEECYGRWVHRANEIHLTTEKTEDGFKQTTWRHEVIHCWLDWLGYQELSKDEKLVDNLASVWMQFDQTVKWRK